MSSKIFADAINNVSEETEARVRLSVEIVERIFQLMRHKNMNQNDLARSLGKTPSEISKWLSGTHNFTLKSIQRLELFLGQPILKVVSEPEELAV
jgi:transcriptional regulator with XRE-family HTH domain